MNDKVYNIDTFKKEITLYKDYIIMEYLYPDEYLANFCPNTVNTIRFLAGKINNNLEMLRGYIRFGTKKSGFVENYAAGGVLCYLNEDGEFIEGHVLNNDYSDRVIYKHPDSNLELKGKVPLWDEVKKCVSLFNQEFPQLIYLGFDFVVTYDNEIKLLEINSLSSLDAMQIYEGLLKENTKTCDFFRNRNS